MSEAEAKNLAAWIADVFTHLNVEQVKLFRDLIYPYNREIVIEAVHALAREREFATIPALHEKILSRIRQRLAAKDNAAARLGDQREIERRVLARIDSLTDAEAHDLREELFARFPPPASMLEKFRRMDPKQSARLRTHFREIIAEEFKNERSANQPGTPAV